MRNIARLDETLLEGFVIHHSSCLDILPSPDVFDDSANVSLDDIQRAIRFLGQNYEFVVIDCPHGVHNLSLATIDCCDELYLIATPDVPALRDLSRYIDRLLQSNVPPDKIKVVINRFSSEGALSLEQIEKAIRQPIAITIPNASSDLIRAMNTGNPILPERKSEFAIQMKKWAASLVPARSRRGGGAETEVCVLELMEVQAAPDPGKETSWLKPPPSLCLTSHWPADMPRLAQSAAGARPAGGEVGGPSRADQQGRPGKAAVHAGHARPAAVAGHSFCSWSPSMACPSAPASATGWPTR